MPGVLQAVRAVWIIFNTQNRRTSPREARSYDPTKAPAPASWTAYGFYLLAHSEWCGGASMLLLLPSAKVRKKQTKHIGLVFPKKKNTEPESVGTAVVMYIRRAVRSICWSCARCRC
jgi:hypothetical protein